MCRADHSAPGASVHRGEVVTFVAAMCQIMCCCLYLDQVMTWSDELCLKLWVNSYCILMHLCNVLYMILPQCYNRNMQRLLTALHLVINYIVT